MYIYIHIVYIYIYIYPFCLQLERVVSSPEHSTFSIQMRPLPTSAFVSIRQHSLAYVSIRLIA